MQYLSVSKLSESGNELIKVDEIKNRIFTIREMQVMIDSDLAEFFGVETKRLNEQVRRNILRFPEEFCFKLSKEEKNKVVAICDHLQNLKYSPHLPYVFTEQGVAMASALINSDIAIMMSIKIMKAFVAMRHFISNNGDIFKRMKVVEIKLLETDIKIEKVLSALETKQIQPKQGIFFEGQVFEAHKFVSDIVRSAEKSIILIDNYVDDTVLTLFSKRKQGVALKILTKNLSKQLILDIQKFNEQFPPAEIKEFNHSHDRFMIIDSRDLYHFGASLKDLGRKWFGFSKMDIEVTKMLARI
ncbi:MAG TPA: ORF6N domain-containing protein [bacterium]|nr:ORF6N domain-containing protein [bacterium]